MSSPGLLLAVDGGGTKTQALVADLQGNVGAVVLACRLLAGSLHAS